MKPVGKGRPRSTRGGHCYTPESTRKAEQAIRTHIEQSFSGALFCGPLEMTIIAYFKRPKKSQTKYGANHPTKKPDIDNIGKLVADSLNHIVYDDDVQVTKMTIQKEYDTYDHIVISVKETS